MCISQSVVVWLTVVKIEDEKLFARPKGVHHVHLWHAASINSIQALNVSPYVKFAHCLSDLAHIPGVVDEGN
jgi:hypothetical protein